MLVLLVAQSQSSLWQIIVDVSISRHIDFMLGLIIDEFGLSACHNISLIFIIERQVVSSFLFFVLQDVHN